MAGGLTKTVLQGANIGDALNVFGGVMDYKYAREQGDNRAVSVAKAVGSFVWGEMLFGGVAAGIEAAGLTGAAGIAANIGFMGAYIGATAGAQIVSTMGQHTARTMGSGYGHRGKFGSGYFDMTETGYTMRQRSLNAIRQNGLNTQSVLGNEARMYYRGS